jgi:hypothetical protein
MVEFLSLAAAAAALGCAVRAVRGFAAWRRALVFVVFVVLRLALRTGAALAARGALTG